MQVLFVDIVSITGILMLYPGKVTNWAPIWIPRELLFPRRDILLIR